MKKGLCFILAAALLMCAALAPAEESNNYFGSSVQIGSDPETAGGFFVRYWNGSGFTFFLPSEASVTLSLRRNRS